MWSIYVHNTEAAYDFLPHADAAIFVVTADPPISEEELTLRVVREHVAKVFFVQNKIDILSRDELQESLEFTSHVIQQTLNRAISLSGRPGECRDAASPYPAQGRPRLGTGLTREPSMLAG